MRTSEDGRLPDPQRSGAVLIGTSTYQSAGLDDLPAVANNLTALHDVLTDPALGGLQPARCIVLADQTDVQEVYRTLRRVAKEASDTLLIYFAGHGLLEPHRNELCLALAGSHQEDLPAGALPFEWIRQLFLNCQATYGVLVLDCCYSGRAAASLGGAEETFLGQLDIKGTYTLAAAGPNQLALAPPGEEYTAFTGELLTLVLAGIPDGPELLTYATIYRHLLRALTARGLPQPHQLNSGTAEHLALAHNPAHPNNTTKPRSRNPPRAGSDGRFLTATPVAEFSTKGVWRLAFSPDGHSLAIATGTNAVPVFDTTTWCQRLTLRQHWLGEAGVYAIAFSPKDSRLATGGTLTTGGVVQHWSVHTGSRLAKVAHDVGVWALAFNPNGGWLATGDRNGRVRIWDTLTGRMLLSIAHNDQVDGVAFSPDKRMLATCSSDQTARIWDAYTGGLKSVLAHDRYVRAVAFSPDGRLLATASTPAFIWDVNTGIELLTLSPEPGAGGRNCHDVAFSSDGRFLAAAYMDHTARIWDTHTGAEMLRLSHDREVRAVAFNADGRWLATGADRWRADGRRGSGAVRIWQLNES